MLTLLVYQIKNYCMTLRKKCIFDVKAMGIKSIRDRTLMKKNLNHPA